jgi:hypothetical protein
MARLEAPWVAHGELAGEGKEGQGGLAWGGGAGGRYRGGSAWAGAAWSLLLLMVFCC